MALTFQSTLKEESSNYVGQFADISFHNITKNSVDTHQILHTTNGYSLSGEMFPDDPINSPTADLILNVGQGGILPLLTLSGITMNVINMTVFHRQGLSDRINLLLFCLSLADTGYITLSMTSRLYTIFGLMDPDLGIFWKWKVQRSIFIGLYRGFMSVSSCLTLLISLERCVCVLWPLKAKTLLSVRRMAVVIVSIFLLCLGFCGLTFVTYQTMSYWDPQTNSTVYYTQHSRFYQENRLLVAIVSDVIFNLSLPTACVGGVMLATLLISLRMRAVLSWRSQTSHVGCDKTMTSSERRESLVTRMLMVVCVVFTVCTIPSVTHSFFRFYMDGFEIGERYNNLFFVTVCLMHIMATINSSGNFFIYWTMSTKFRDTLRHLLSCLGKWSENRDPSLQ